jgi:RNase P/RNase MRP subunit p30
MAAMLKRLGYSLAGFVFSSASYGELSDLKKAAAGIGMDALVGFEAISMRELKFLKKRRKGFDLLVVRGSDFTLVRKASQTSEVDLLIPQLQMGICLDYVTTRFARDSGVAIGISLDQLLTSTDRARVLANMRESITLAKKYGTELVLTSGARDEWELRDPWCMIGIGVMLGMELKEAKEAVSSTPLRIARLSKQKQAPEWVMPGVRVLR